MNKLFLFFFFCCGISVYGQDTICLKSKTSLVVRVLEISKNEVKYKFFNNPDGVIHIVSNSEIEYIMYENGKKERLFIKTKDLLLKKEPFFIIEDKHISLDNKDITHAQAFDIMLKKNVSSNSEELNLTLLKAEGNKNSQIAFLIFSPLTFLAGFSIAKRNYYGPKDLQKSQTIFLSGFVLATSCLVTSGIFKIIKNKNIRLAADLYNQENLLN